MRLLLILTITIAVIIGCLVLIVGIALNRMKAAAKQADQAWVPPTKTPATSPSAPATAPGVNVRPDPAPVIPAPPPVPHPEPILLFAIDSKLHGQTLWKSDGIIGNWKDASAYVEWPLTCMAGEYRIDLTYSLGAGPRPVTVEVAGRVVNADLTPTTNWDHFVTTSAGTINLPGGDVMLRVKPGPGARFDEPLMHLRSVCLLPPGTTAPNPIAATIVLTASNAELHGDRIQRSSGADSKITNWISSSDWAEWSLRAMVRQNYRASVTLSNADTTGGDFDLLINKEAVHCHAGSTGGFGNPRIVPLGKISIPAGRVLIQIKPAGEFHNALMNLWKVEFVPE